MKATTNKEWLQQNLTPKPGEGTARCPRCKNRYYYFENDHFRCSNCSLLVDSLANVVVDKNEKIAPKPGT